MIARFAVLALLAVVMVEPAGAGPVDDEIEALKAQVRTLGARIAELEKARDEPAGSDPAGSSAPEWTRRLDFSGDLRYRHETIDEQGLKTRNRHRIRARFGVEAALADGLDATLRLASGGGDPRSTNETLGDNFSNKDIAIDLAFFDWQPTAGLHVLAGKMKSPLRQPDAGRFIDSDVTPEGVALAWRRDGYFASASGFWGVERSDDDETMLFAVQAGVERELAGAVMVTAAVSYRDWTHAEGFAPFFEGDPLGNSIDAAGALVHDFDVVDVFGELVLSLAGRPFTVHAQYGINTAAQSEDTAYSVGVALGEVSTRGTWRVGYAWHDHEKDALFAQIVDSDFGGGRTDARGHVLEAGVGLTSKLRLGLTYFDNEVDVESPLRRDYDRVQVDLELEY